MPGHQQLLRFQCQMSYNTQHAKHDIAIKQSCSKEVRTYCSPVNTGSKCTNVHERHTNFMTTAYFLIDFILYFIFSLITGYTKKCAHNLSSAVFVHNDVIKWNHFPRYWSFWGTNRSPVNVPHKGQWRGALMFSLICLNRRLSKQSRRRWFETPSRSLWRHSNVVIRY